MFFDLEILESTKIFSTEYIFLLLLNKSKFIECPIVATFRPLNGKEFSDAVTTFSENKKAKYNISFLSPILGPGCVNHSVVFILCLTKKNFPKTTDIGDIWEKHLS